MKAAADPSSADDLDPACVGCGYLLRGLAREGNCPECGVAVARSLAGDRLSWADPKWMAKVAKGARRMRLGCQLVAWTLVLCVSGALTGLVPTWHRSGLASIVDGLLVLAIGTILLGFATAMTGTSLMTTRDPRTSDSEPFLTVRRAARMSMIAYVVFGAASFAAWGSTALVATSVIWWYLCAATMTAWWCASVLHLSDLMRRIPRHGLADRLRQIALEWGVMILVLSVFSQQGWAFAIRGALGLIAMLTFFVMLVWLNRLAKLLGESRDALDHCSRRAAAWAGSSSRAD